MLPSMLSSAAHAPAVIFLLLIAATGCGSDAGPAAPQVAVPEPPDPALVAGGIDAASLKLLGSLTAAVKKTPRDHGAWKALANGYETSRVPAGAHVAYAAAAALNPTDPKLWYRAAIMASGHGDVELALERVGKVLELETQYGPAWRRQGTWLLDLGRAEDAQVAFERAAALMPGDPDAFVGLARVALSLDDVQAALQLAESALERAPGDPYVRNILGTALRRAGRADDAKSHLLAGQDSTPRYRDPWSEEVHRASRQEENSIARVEVLIAEKRWDEAIVLLRELQRNSPTNSKLPLRLGVALMSARRFDEAIAHYNEAKLLFPASYELQTASVAALNATGRVAEALKVADETIGRWPDRAPAYLQRGAALETMRDFEAARAAFQHASLLKPSDLRGPLFEGRMLAKLGRYRESAQVMEAALDLPGASAPIIYFKSLIGVMTASGASRDDLERIAARASVIHGAAADDLLP